MTAVRAARQDDFHAWLALARDLEPLFGPMVDVPEFRAGLAGAIAAGTALAVDDATGAFAGGLLFEPDLNAIAWLGVTAAVRGRGLGGALLAAGLAALDPDRPIGVQTFAPGCAEGEAARALYLDRGFVDAAPADPAPSGLPTVLMRRPAASAS